MGQNFEVQGLPTSGRSTGLRARWHGERPQCCGSALANPVHADCINAWSRGVGDEPTARCCGRPPRSGEIDPSEIAALTSPDLERQTVSRTAGARRQIGRTCPREDAIVASPHPRTRHHASSSLGVIGQLWPAGGARDGAAGPGTVGRRARGGSVWPVVEAVAAAGPRSERTKPTSALGISAGDRDRKGVGRRGIHMERCRDLRRTRQQAARLVGS